jgi:uncharacterized protein YndB with AHSA1/START domain
MKITLISLAALALLCLGVFGLGSLLPREHRATSRAVLPVPIDSVWQVIRDLEKVPSWWPEVTSATRLEERDGQERVQQSYRDDFSMTLVVKESIRPSRLRTEIEPTPSADFGGGWIYELAPAEGGTEVRLTEDGWISNRLFRVVSWITGYHRTLDDYLSALGRRFGMEVKVEHVLDGRSEGR